MNSKLIKTCLILSGLLSILFTACASTDTNTLEYDFFRIPDQILGSWVEFDKGVEGDSLIITSENIRWKRKDAFNTGEYTFKSGQYGLVDGGTVVKFSARNACKKDIVGFPADGPVQVTIKLKGDDLILDISRTTIQRSEHIWTCSSVSKVFKRSPN